MLPNYHGTRMKSKLHKLHLVFTKNEINAENK